MYSKTNDFFSGKKLIEDIHMYEGLDPTKLDIYENIANKFQSLFQKHGVKSTLSSYYLFAH